MTASTATADQSDFTPVGQTGSGITLQGNNRLMLLTWARNYNASLELRKT